MQNNEQNNTQTNMQNSYNTNGQGIPYSEMYGTVQQPLTGSYQGSYPQKKKKKHGCLTFFLVLIGGFVLLIVGMAVIVSVGVNTDIDLPSDTGNSNSAVSDRMYHVGETFSSNGFEVTMTEFGEYKDYTEWTPPSEGNKVVYAKFYFKNSGDSDVAVSYMFFHGYCNNSEVSQFYGMDNTGIDFSLNLSNGRNGEGTVAFEIPEDVEDLSVFEIEYETNIWTEDKIKFVGEGDGQVVTSQAQ